MNSFLAKRAIASWHISRDPVIRTLTLLRTLNQYSAGYQLQPYTHRKHAEYNPQPKSAIICRQQSRHLHVGGRLRNKRHSHQRNDHKKFEKSPRLTYLKYGMTVENVAEKLGIPIDEVLEALLVITEKEYTPEQGVNSEDILEKVGLILHRNVKIVKDKKFGDVKQIQTERVQPSKMIVGPENQDVRKQGPPDPKSLVNRPPVVTIMGHVDHGKTTLLDALREASVVDQEFGGITQHIGAFSVNLPSGHSITFLDTPGHAAFTAMRARGASVTDIIVLVIAAEDGIMPQTIESIQHARDEKVPLIVAINKIDKYEANIENTKNMLAAHDVILEEYGGDVQAVPISALKRINLDKLEECITTLAEFLELKGDPKGFVEGRIIETRTDIGCGKMATLLIQRGTLKKGDLLIAGTSWTKVRNMYDNNGKVVNLATPSTPVEIGGWRELPQIGDEVLQVQTEKLLKKALAYRQELKENEKGENVMQIIQEKRKEEREQYLKLKQDRAKYWEDIGRIRRMNLTRFEKINKFRNPTEKKQERTEDKPTFYLVIKGDVAGSVEAITDTLATFNSDFCNIDILHSGIGDVSKTDIELAELFDGIIYAFNVSPIVNENVTIKNYNVIYHLFDDLVQTINERLAPVTEEVTKGEAKILKEYKYKEKRKDVSKQIQIAGCRCVSGNLSRKNMFKIMRGEETIFNGKVSSLKHLKEEASIVGGNQEFGICFDAESKISFQPGDTVVCYEIVQKPGKLEWEPGFHDSTSQSLY